MVPWWPPVLDSPTRVNILPMVSLSGSFVSFYISMKMYIFFKFQKIQQIPRCCLNCWIFLTLPIFCFELMVSLFLKSCACANQACHADPTSLALTTHYTDQEAYFTGNNCHEAISTCCFFHSFLSFCISILCLLSYWKLIVSLSSHSDEGLQTHMLTISLSADCALIAEFYSISFTSAGTSSPVQPFLFRRLINY